PEPRPAKLVPQHYYRFRCGRHHRSAAALPTVRVSNERPWPYRIFARVSLRFPRTIVSAIPATACCACCEPHAARLADVLGFLFRWHTTPRCVPEPQLQREICAQPRDQETFSGRAPSTPLPEC